jgi:acylphosphatase
MVQDRHAVKVRVTGRVQGVYFRGWTRERAQTLGLAGWVRNEHDGSVAALIAGPRAVVEDMLRLLHEGPLDAKVAEVIVEETDPDQVPSGFSILH